MESLLTLAHQYAARHGTKIISHRITGDQITFILESGPKQLWPRLHAMST